MCEMLVTPGSVVGRGNLTVLDMDGVTKLASGAHGPAPYQDRFSPTGLSLVVDVLEPQQVMLVSGTLQVYSFPLDRVLNRF